MVNRGVRSWLLTAGGRGGGWWGRSSLGNSTRLGLISAVTVSSSAPALKG